MAQLIDLTCAIHEESFSEYKATSPFGHEYEGAHYTYSIPRAAIAACTLMGFSFRFAVDMLGPFVQQCWNEANEYAKTILEEE